MQLAILIGAVGATLACFYGFGFLMTGRLIYGFSVGLIAIAMPRSMEETVPEHLVGVFGGLYCLSFATAVLTAYSLAAILPPDTDTQALVETKKTLWFFGMPLIVYTIMLIIQVFYLKNEPIKFLLTHGKTDLATTEVMKFYKYATDRDKATEIANILNRSCQKSTSSITISEAFCSRKYRNGSYVALMVMAIHELNCGNAVMLQTNAIFAQMKGFALTPRQGTMLIGYWNFFSAACSLFTGKRFTRRFLIAGGHTLIGVMLLLFGLLNQLDKPDWAFFALLSYLFVMQTTDNAVTWLYCSEIAADVSLGFVGVVGYLMTFGLTYAIGPMEASFIGLAGTFYLFGAEQLLAGLWAYFYLKETSNGLTDK